MKEIKNIKDKVYELEGLLELADMRPDKLSELAPLISRRLEAVVDAWKVMKAPVAEPVAAEPVVTKTVVTEPAVTEPAVTEVPAAPAPRKVPTLCLNDRFRFTRVMAGGDRALFDARLAEIAAMPDFETARDYVADTCGVDPDDPDVADFLDILQRYFEE